MGEVSEVSFGNPMGTGLVLDHPSPPLKKKRNLPGNPDPEAEVVALSPRSLMATNRFVCEICGKGFQRDQNLQLHRRGHNLPWKLKQRNALTEKRKRVYVCPELTCVHHHPSRALGDLTGIKKHFCRKHGDKKWKCDKCGKRYAVHSDCKAHSKTCGTREYKCHCGTLFSRRDSFVTHRAFCDALAEETAKMNTNMNMNMMGYHFMGWMDQYKTTAMRPLAPSSTAYNEFITTTSLPLMANDNSNNTFVFDQTLNSATALLQKAAQVGATTSSSFSFAHPQQTCALYSQPPLVIYPPPQKRRRINLEDETRDFLGGGVRSICQPSTVNGWI